MLTEKNSLGQEIQSLKSRFSSSQKVVKDLQTAKEEYEVIMAREKGFFQTKMSEMQDRLVRHLVGTIVNILVPAKLMVCIKTS